MSDVGTTAIFPETRPICSLNELFSKAEMDVDEKLVGKRLKNYRSNRNSRQTLVCHDMKGGYLLEDRLEGCCVEECVKPYTFFHWWYVDVFVYFSHNFITIPPVAWIDQAHDHGVLILGTFITEWKDGKKLCEEIFGEIENVVRIVSIMLKLAQRYNFDGWLINIENKIEEDHLESLALFLLLLTDEMRAAIGERSRVVWYDSVTVSDGIFLNYGWKKRALISSASRAKTRKGDVYVGVDCHGRGCYGGGGWNCHEAFSCARGNELSVALFAPGWIAENFAYSDFTAHSLRFWDRLAPLVYSHPITELPVRTNFSIGFNVGGNKKGFKRGSAELQPFYLASGLLRQSYDLNLLLPGPGSYRILEFDVKLDTDLEVKITADGKFLFVAWIDEKEVDLSAEEGSTNIWRITKNNAKTLHGIGCKAHDTVIVNEILVRKGCQN